MPVLTELLPKNSIRSIAEFRFSYEYFGDKIGGSVFIKVLNDSAPEETEALLTLPLSDLAFTEGEANAVKDLLRAKLQDLAQDNNLTVYVEE